MPRRAPAIGPATGLSGSDQSGSAVPGQRRAYGAPWAANATLAALDSEAKAGPLAAGLDRRAFALDHCSKEGASGGLGLLPPPLWGRGGGGGVVVARGAGSNIDPHPQPLPTAGCGLARLRLT